MSRSRFWVLYLLTIAVSMYFLADMLNLVLGARLSTATDIPKRIPLVSKISNRVEKSGVSSDTLVKMGSDYQIIIDGNIFNSKMRGRTIQEESLIYPPTEPLSVLSHFSLLGTMVASESGSYAVFEDTKTKEQLLYKEGGFLSEGVQIIKIGRNRVLVRTGEREEVLEVLLPFEENTMGLIPQPVVIPSPLSGVRQISKNRWILDRREIDSAVENLPKLFTKARIIPNFSDGKPDGFRIFAISEDSLYSKIGLQNGDILHRINGIEVKEPQNFVRVFEQLKNETYLVVDLIRNNQKETFNYEVR